MSNQEAVKFDEEELCFKVKDGQDLLLHPSWKDLQLSAKEFQTKITPTNSSLS